MPRPNEPFFFTEREGGDWLPWPYGKLIEPADDLDQRAHTVWINGERGQLLVHSLYFRSLEFQGKARSGSDPYRWDSWNGWNGPVEDL